MSATTELLDRYKAARGIESDNAAGIALGLKRQTISGWRNQGKQAEPAVLWQMAEAIGEDGGRWLAQVEAERARTKADREAWSILAKRLGAVAALFVAAALPYQVNASALTGAHAEPQRIVGIMRSVRRWLRAAFAPFLHGGPHEQASLLA